MMNNNYSHIRENIQEGTASYYHEEEPSSIFCGCFRFPCFESKEDEANSLLQENKRDSWMVQKLKEVKEFSEVVAGPKWKNMVRKIGKYCNNPKKRTAPFQYDSDSYALNFDNADADGLFRNFSSRFAAPFSAAPLASNTNAGSIL